MKKQASEDADSGDMRQADTRRKYPPKIFAKAAAGGQKARGREPGDAPRRSVSAAKTPTAQPGSEGLSPAGTKAPSGRLLREAKTRVSAKGDAGLGSRGRPTGAMPTRTAGEWGA